MPWETVRRDFAEVDLRDPYDGSEVHLGAIATNYAVVRHQGDSGMRYAAIESVR